MLVALKSSVPIPDGAVLKRAYQQEMGRFVTEVHKVMATYPPQAPEAAPVFARRAYLDKAGRRRTHKVVVRGYKRTGNLGRGWTHKVEVIAGRGIVGTVGNFVEYGIHVEGPVERGAQFGFAGFGVGRAQGQTALMGARGWPAIDMVARSRWAASQRILEAVAQNWAKRGGRG